MDIRNKEDIKHERHHIGWQTGNDKIKSKRLTSTKKDSIRQAYTVTKIENKRKTDHEYHGQKLNCKKKKIITADMRNDINRNQVKVPVQRCAQCWDVAWRRG